LSLLIDTIQPPDFFSYIIKTERIYNSSRGRRGNERRILVDRLWPRGLSKEKAGIDEWMKDIAPSDELRKWFGHDPKKWPEFKKRYFRELKDKKSLIDEIMREVREGPVVFLYSAKDTLHNNAVVLKEYIETLALEKS
jgi:uncharacterized protein YeaO (DUF488 family)